MRRVDSSARETGNRRGLIVSCEFAGEISTSTTWFHVIFILCAKLDGVFHKGENSKFVEGGENDVLPSLTTV